MEVGMTKKIKRKRQSILFFTILGLVFLTGSAFAWQTQEPETAAAWEKMMGFKAPDVVGKIAPEIKPGLVIDGNNYKQFPGLKELLPQSLYSRLDPNSYAPLAPIKIAETDQYHLGAGYIKKSLLSAKTCKLAADGLTLEGYQGGFPFIHPKNGNEQVQICANPYLGDTFAMRPMRLRLYNSKEPTGTGASPEFKFSALQ